MPMLSIDKTKPPMISGYRKILALGLGLVVVALFGIFYPDQVDNVGQWVATLVATYFGGNVANAVARTIKEAKVKAEVETKDATPILDDAVLPPPALPPS